VGGVNLQHVYVRKFLLETRGIVVAIFATYTSGRRKIRNVRFELLLLLEYNYFNKYKQLEQYNIFLIKIVESII
jgi:hypothetical protein